VYLCAFDARFEVFTAVKIEVKVFWVVMLCSVAGGHHHTGGPCCLYLQGEVKMEVARPSKTLVYNCNTTWLHNAENFDFNSVHLFIQVSPRLSKGLFFSTTYIFG
jgi:hypothetical protein